jgi:RNA-directed DNA polymerase
MWETLLFLQGWSISDKHNKQGNLYRTAAVGIDGMTKEKYGENLEENLDALLSKLKTMSYIPGPVK